MRTHKIFPCNDLVRPQVIQLETVALHSPAIYFVVEPLSRGRIQVTLRAGSVAYRTTIEQPHDRDFMAEQLRAADEFAAREIIAAHIDRQLDDTAQTVSVAPKERRARKLRREGVPNFFQWVATSDDRHLVWANSAAYSSLWPRGQWRELAGHPSIYGDLWSVYENPPKDSVGGTLHFKCLPSFERWAQFETIDARLWRERLSHNSEQRDERTRSNLVASQKQRAHLWSRAARESSIG